MVPQNISWRPIKYSRNPIYQKQFWHFMTSIGKHRFRDYSWCYYCDISCVWKQAVRARHLYSSAEIASSLQKNYFRIIVCGYIFSKIQSRKKVFIIIRVDWLQKLKILCQSNKRNKLLTIHLATVNFQKVAKSCDILYTQKFNQVKYLMRNYFLVKLHDISTQNVLIVISESSHGKCSIEKLFIKIPQ